MGTPRLLLLARPGDARASIQDALADARVVHEAAESVADARSVLARAPHNGLLFEVSTLLHHTRAERDAARAWGSLFPAAAVRLDARADELRVLPLGTLAANASTLADFIAHDCRCFAPRRLRAAPRTPRLLPVLVGDDPPFRGGAGPRRAVISDLNEGGCFVVEAGRVFTPGERVSLIVPEFCEPVPVVATVRWSSPWGVSGRLPGAGVRFDVVGDGQRARIRALLRA